MPSLAPFARRRISMRPPPPWTSVLRASSLIAVAIRVLSINENLSSPASSRAAARATTMSSSERMSMDAIDWPFIAGLLGGFDIPATAPIGSASPIDGGKLITQGLEAALDVHRRVDTG